MLRRLKVENFKAVRKFKVDRPSLSGENPIQHGEEDDSLKFRNLTIFAGANSSGKSSIIQSILLIAQTLERNDVLGLNFNGELISLGDAVDVQNHESSPDDPIVYHIVISDTNDINNLEHEVHLSFHRLDEKRVHLSGATYLSHELGSDINNDRTLNISLIDNNNYLLKSMSEFWTSGFIEELTQRGYIESADDVKRLFIRTQNILIQEIHIDVLRTKNTLDWNMALINPLNPQLRQYDDEIIESEYREILFRAIKTLKLKKIRDQRSSAKLTLRDYYTWFGERTAKDSEQLKQYFTKNLKDLKEEIHIEYVPSFIKQINGSFLDVFTKNLRYLSANRQAPTMLFNSNKTFLWAEVGINGENVASAIRDYGHHIISLYNQDTNTFEENSVLFFTGVWMRRFNLIQDVAITDRGKMGISLEIIDEHVKKPLDLTSIGFGTSQILPIIVQGLLTPPNGTFIVEQPEVHLHPTAQAKLADFFLTLARSNIQCIIETHSDHIIKRLQLRIVQDETSDTMDQIQIYFAEKKEGRSRFVEVVANEYGAIPEWPDGFFDQAEIDYSEISYLSAKKRQLRKKTKS